MDRLDKQTDAQTDMHETLQPKKFEGVGSKNILDGKKIK
jgi:hypothetical protein